MDLKRSLGFKFQNQNILFRGFVVRRRARRRVHAGARVLAWAARAPSPEHRRNRLLTVRRFALALHAENARHEDPAADALGRATSKRRPPYIYRSDEIVRLMRAAAPLKPPGSIRPILYTTLFGLIAATGMRIAEALALQLDDVTADGLVIRETKFQKSRLLPLHATGRAGTRRYLIGSRKVSAADRALFISVSGRSLPYNTVRCLPPAARSTGLRGVHGRRDPRIHDLRHTFAVRSLEQCRHDRDAVARHIVALSTYLGHAHVTDTYWYLQATPVLMGQIAEAGEALLVGGVA